MTSIYIHLLCILLYSWHGMYIRPSGCLLMSPVSRMCLYRQVSPRGRRHPSLHVDVSRATKHWLQLPAERKCQMRCGELAGRALAPYGSTAAEITPRKRCAISGLSPSSIAIVCREIFQSLISGTRYKLTTVRFQLRFPHVRCGLNREAPRYFGFLAERTDNSALHA
jgi:hypothetical protein